MTILVLNTPYFRVVEIYLHRTPALLKEQAWVRYLEIYHHLVSIPRSESSSRLQFLKLLLIVQTTTFCKLSNFPRGLCQQSCSWVALSPSHLDTFKFCSHRNLRRSSRCYLLGSGGEWLLPGREGGMDKPGNKETQFIE